MTRSLSFSLQEAQGTLIWTLDLYVSVFACFTFCENTQYASISLIVCATLYEKLGYKMNWYFIDEHDVRYVAGYDLGKLTTDQFYLDINYTSFVEEVYLYYLNEQCVGCPYVIKPFANGTPLETNLRLRLSNKHKHYLYENDPNVVCDLDYSFGQFGVYTVTNNSQGCEISITKEAVNIYTPIFTVFMIYAALIFSGYIIVCFWKWYSKKDSDYDVKKEPDSQKQRIQCLDTFRGVIITIMIFANFGCGDYEYINHAKWNGLHIADLVFPSFIWIMGACIPISLMSSFKKNVQNRVLIVNILKRSVKLFLLGIFLGGGVDLSYFRVFGVLQRFGVVYLIVSLICIYTMDKSPTEITIDAEENPSLKNHFLDILRLYKGWIIVIFIVLIHTIILFAVAAPGCERGYMGPGGLHQNLSNANCIGGATGYLDGLILGNHRYQRPTIYKVYEAKPFDPEGVVGCLTTILQAYIGVQAGVTLLVYKAHWERLIRWLIWAVVTGLTGGILCDFSKEDGVIPVNKNLWSLSFVLVTSCFAFTFLSLCYLLVDCKKWWTGKPFLFAGMNAILMYIGHEMTDNHFPVRWYPHNDYSHFRRTHFVALLSDIWGAGFWIAIAYYLYKIDYLFVV